LHLQIGNDGKSDVFPTISSQIGYIRQILTENLKKDNYYGQAARGEIPTIFNSHNKDEIASIIELKRDFVPKGRFVVMGGSEAHLVAPFLAQHDIAVVLQPALCTPARFDSIHCLTGAPLTNGTAAHVLQSHRVKLGLGIFDSGLARNLLWDAGWLAATSPEALPEGGISETEAIQFVTSNIRDIFGLDASPPNEFIVVSGSPFDLKSRILFSHDPVHGVKQSASDRSFKNEKHK
jgi:hypothetical protein